MPILRTVAQKENRIRQIGRPWSDLLTVFQRHRSLTPEEKKNQHAEAIARSREAYYGQYVQSVLECALRSPEGRKKSK